MLEERVSAKWWGLVEVEALDFLEMEGHGYDRFGDGERDTYQIDYRRIVGDMEPARPRISNRDGEQPHPYGAFALPTPHGHGHETAAQRYSATRIQAGYEPERSVLLSTLIRQCSAHAVQSPLVCRGDCVNLITCEQRISTCSRAVFTF